MKETIEKVNKNNFFITLKGTCLAILITVVLLFVFALFLAYTNIPETTITPAVITISAISILIGSIISSRKIKKQGLINGGATGLIYVMCIYLISSVLQSDFSLNIYSIIMIIAAIFTGLLGGIIGVNI